MLLAWVQNHRWVLDQSFSPVAFEQSSTVSDVVYQSHWCSRIVTFILEKGYLVGILSLLLLLHIWWHFVVFDCGIRVVEIIGDLLVIDPSRVLVIDLEVWCRHVLRMRLGLRLSSFLPRNLGRHRTSWYIMLPMRSLHLLLITKCVLHAFGTWIVSRNRVLGRLMMNRLIVNRLWWWHQTSLRMVVDSCCLWRHN